MTLLWKIKLKFFFQTYCYIGHCVRQEKVEEYSAPVLIACPEPAFKPSFFKGLYRVIYLFTYWDNFNCLGKCIMYITLFKPCFFQRKQSDLTEYRKNILVWCTKTTKVWKLHLNVACLHEHVLSIGLGLGNSNVWVQVCTIKII